MSYPGEYVPQSQYAEYADPEERLRTFRALRHFPELRSLSMEAAGGERILEPQDGESSPIKVKIIPPKAKKAKPRPTSATLPPGVNNSTRQVLSSLIKSEYSSINPMQTAQRTLIQDRMNRPGKVRGSNSVRGSVTSTSTFITDNNTKVHETGTSSASGNTHLESGRQKLEKMAAVYMSGKHILRGFEGRLLSIDELRTQICVSFGCTLTRAEMYAVVQDLNLLSSQHKREGVSGAEFLRTFFRMGQERRTAHLTAERIFQETRSRAERAAEISEKDAHNAACVGILSTPYTNEDLIHARARLGEASWAQMARGCRADLDAAHAGFSCLVDPVALQKLTAIYYKVTLTDAETCAIFNALSGSDSSKSTATGAAEPSADSTSTKSATLDANVKIDGIAYIHWLNALPTAAPSKEIDIRKKQEARLAANAKARAYALWAGEGEPVRQKTTQQIWLGR